MPVYYFGLVRYRKFLTLCQARTIIFYTLRTYQEHKKQGCYYNSNESKLFFSAGLDAVNDVDGEDYTGFSLLGEDLLGGIFGSSGSKKPNKNKKKQAPSSTTTTTTTKRPRPNRRTTTRRPSSRTTTQRPVRTTTVRIRPTTRRPNRRPARRPTRPNRKTTTVAPSISDNEVTNLVEQQSSVSQSTESNKIQTTATFLTQTPSILTTNSKIKVQSTTPKSQPVTNFEDPGLQMSLAHITGQLSEMPVTTIITTVKDNGSTAKDMVQYEKIETITPKNPSTVSFGTSSAGASQEVDDDMVQIVDSLDSQSSENILSSVEPNKNIDEGRGDKDVLYSFADNAQPVDDGYYEGLSLSKNKHKKHRGNDNDYDDVLGLTSIGESIIHSYHTLGLDGGNRKHKRKQGNGRKNNDYDDILGIQALGDTLGFGGSNKKENKKKDGRRRNKMMRGDWSSA